MKHTFPIIFFFFLLTTTVFGVMSINVNPQTGLANGLTCNDCSTYYWNVDGDTGLTGTYIGDFDINTSGDIKTTRWFRGKFNWTSGDNWNIFDGTNLLFNESKLETTFYNATQSLAVAGTIDSGTLVDTQHQDGDYDEITFNFSEASGSPGLDLRVNFTGITDFNKGYIRYKTSSLSGDYPTIQLWDYDESEWEGGYGFLSETEDFLQFTNDVLDSSSHIQDGVVQMRLYKSANGNTNNHYYVDMLAIVDGYATPSGNVDLTPYWRYDDDDEDRDFTTTGTGTFGDLSVTDLGLTIDSSGIIQDYDTVQNLFISLNLEGTNLASIYFNGATTGDTIFNNQMNSEYSFIGGGTDEIRLSPNDHKLEFNGGSALIEISGDSLSFNSVVNIKSLKPFISVNGLYVDDAGAQGVWQNGGPNFGEHSLGGMKVDSASSGKFLFTNEMFGSYDFDSGTVDGDVIIFDAYDTNSLIRAQDDTFEVTIGNDQGSGTAQSWLSTYGDIAFMDTDANYDNDGNMMWISSDQNNHKVQIIDNVNDDYGLKASNGTIITTINNGDWSVNATNGIFANNFTLKDTIWKEIQGTYRSSFGSNYANGYSSNLSESTNSYIITSINMPYDIIPNSTIQIWSRIVTPFAVNSTHKNIHQYTRHSRVNDTKFTPMSGTATYHTLKEGIISNFNVNRFNTVNISNVNPNEQITILLYRYPGQAGDTYDKDVYGILPTIKYQSKTP